MDNDVFNLSSTVTSQEARHKGKKFLVTRRNIILQCTLCIWAQRVTRTNPKRRKGSTNKELCSWKWDLSSPRHPPSPRPLPWFLAQTDRNRGMGKKMQTFSEQPSGQTFPKQRRVVCQCHILAWNMHIFWNFKISPHMFARVQNAFPQECWLFRWF